MIRLNVSFSLPILAIFIGISMQGGAFNVYGPRITQDLTNNWRQFFPNNNEQQNNQHYKRDKVILNSWLKDALNNLGLNFLQEKQKFGNQLNENDKNEKGVKGTVIRTAAKKFDASNSKPSSPLYTTRKETQGQILIRPQGVEGDYNHYRTIALSSTADRAVSILTTDIFEQLKNVGYDKIQIGDLGENIYVDGVDYKFFELGKRYKFSKRDTDDSSSSNKKIQDDDDGVIVEITERIEPCRNLCKLPFINDEALPPTDRFENCKKFLLWLDQKDGLRGWYAKIIGDGGQVQIGDQVAPLVIAEGY